MKILLTSTSFIDTPGLHQEKLYNAGFEIDFLRGPIEQSMLLPIISKYDGIICGDDEITREVILKGKEGNLKVISKYGIGLDKIDLNAAKELNIPVTNCPGVNHVAVAEHIIALLFSYYKNIHLEHVITKKGSWQRLIGHEVYGKKMGILGLGRIGKELAIRMLALGLDVLVYDPYLDKEYAKKNKIKTVEKIEDLIRDIDILSLTLPLTGDSQGIINSQLLSKAKKNIVLINTSRALIIDQDSLIVTLEAGSIKSWQKFIKNKGINIGIDQFGESAPYKEVYNHFGLSEEKITGFIQKKLRE